VRRESATAGGLFAVSALTLLVEIVQTRVFSYSLHPLIAYSAIALAMLGFGLGAAALTLRPSLSGDNPQQRLAHLCLALGAAILLVNVSFAQTSPNVIPVDTMWVSPGWTAVALLPCVIPYLIAGLITALILQSGLARIGRLYFWNLAGAALGCALVMVLLRPLGAERLVVLAASAACGAAALFAWSQRNRLRWIAIAAGLAGLLATPFADRWIAFQPDSNDLLYIYSAKQSTKLQREFSQWDPVGRIEVLRHEIPHLHVTEPVDYRTITNDSGAMALLIQAGEPGWGKAIFEESIYSLPYRLKQQPDVLVIGVGGGIDVHAALHWNARRVTGVEVSASTLHILQGPYARFTRWKEQGDRVQLVHADGRAFARSTKQQFDIVQMSGVDTFTMHSASAMVTAEDYLYTIDAFVDFLGLLKDDGVLAVTRFGDEAMNLSTLAAAALRRLGVSQPQGHIFAAQQGDASGIVVKRTALTSRDITILQKVGERTEPNGVRIPHYDDVGLRASDPVRVLHPPMGPPDPRYVSFFEEMAEGRELGALRKLNNPFVPPTDDRPYYMLLGIWMAASQTMHPVVGTLRVVTLIIAATSLILILAPLLVVRRRSKAGLAALGSVIVYFFALGAGFMLLEVGLIHRTLVFVGSPAASVSVVITAILLSSGIGAHVSDRVGWPLAHRLLFALSGMIGVALLFRLGAQPLFDALFPFPAWARWMTAALAIAPGGFFAGWFFPVGLRIISARSEALVPWAIAVNGFASVLGSLATLSLGVSFGFGTVFLIGLAAYGIAIIAMIPMALRHPNP
jgi:hypothetical protein